MTHWGTKYVVGDTHRITPGSGSFASFFILNKFCRVLWVPWLLFLFVFWSMRRFWVHQWWWQFSCEIFRNENMRRTAIVVRFRTLDIGIDPIIFARNSLHSRRRLRLWNDERFCRFQGKYGRRRPQVLSARTGKILFPTRLGAHRVRNIILHCRNIPWDHRALFELKHAAEIGSHQMRKAFVWPSSCSGTVSSTNKWDFAHSAVVCSQGLEEAIRTITIVARENGEISDMQHHCSARYCPELALRPPEHRKPVAARSLSDRSAQEIAVHVQYQYMQYVHGNLIFKLKSQFRFIL